MPPTYPQLQRCAGRSDRQAAWSPTTAVREPQRAPTNPAFAPIVTPPGSAAHRQGGSTTTASHGTFPAFANGTSPAGRAQHSRPASAGNASSGVHAGNVAAAWTTVGTMSRDQNSSARSRACSSCRICSIESASLAAKYSRSCSAAAAAGASRTHVATCLRRQSSRASAKPSRLGAHRFHDELPGSDGSLDLRPESRRIRCDRCTGARSPR